MTMGADVLSMEALPWPSGAQERPSHGRAVPCFAEESIRSVADGVRGERLPERFTAAFCRQAVAALTRPLRGLNGSPSEA